MSIHKKYGFTLIELLVVVGILAVLVLVTLFFLNPSQLASQGRDTNRVADVTTLNQNLALYHETDPSGSLGSSSILYISIPDPLATSTAGDQCQGLGLSPSYSYHCAASSTYRNNNGTGWVPVNFAAASGVTFPTLPVDPINTTSSNKYYVYVTNGTQYEVLANPEAQKTISSSASSSYIQGNNIVLQPTFPGPRIWVADTNNNRIEEFSMNGVYLSSFGSYGSGNGQLSAPGGVTVDQNGNIWVADTNNDRVEEFSATGTYLSQFGSAGYGNGQFYNPENIAIDQSGNLWVTGPGLHRGAEEFSATGTYLSSFGTSGAGTQQFVQPWGIVIDQNDNFWISDESGNRVMEYSSSGAYLSQFGGSPGSLNNQLGVPWGIVIDTSGNIWVTSGNNKVFEYSSTGTFLSQFGSSGSSTGQFGQPYGIAIDSSGNFWVADTQNNRIEEFSPSGTYLSQFGSYGSSTGQLNLPVGITIK